MHKTFISYHHAREQDLKDKIIDEGVIGGEFIDKSVSDGDIDPNSSEETIMRKIREEYLGDSTVVIVLIGEETAERPFVNSEIQAALWGENPSGLVGIVRDELYDKIYSFTTTCSGNDCNCGITLRSPTYEFNKKVPFLIKENNTRLENNESTSPHYNDSDAYCGIYKFSTFFNNMEKYIDEAFDKREKNFDIKKRNENGVKTIRNPYGFSFVNLN